jgi:hypothetical protein
VRAKGPTEACRRRLRRGEKRGSGGGVVEGDVVGSVDGCVSVGGGSVRTVVGVGRERVTTRSPAEVGTTGGKTRALTEAGDKG